MANTSIVYRMVVCLLSIFSKMCQLVGSIKVYAMYSRDEMPKCGDWLINNKDEQTFKIVKLVLSFENVWNLFDICCKCIHSVPRGCVSTVDS